MSTAASPDVVRSERPGGVHYRLPEHPRYFLFAWSLLTGIGCLLVLFFCGMPRQSPLVVLVPVGVRLVTWQGSRRQALDPAMVQAGEMLFHHEWKPNDPLAGGDGLGPVYNATSCVACHNQGGAGGAGGREHNVTTFVVTEKRPDNARAVPREGVVHADAVNCPPDTLKHVHPQLPEISKPTLSLLLNPSGEPADKDSPRIHFREGVHLSQRNTTALFGARLIDALPDRVLIDNERQQQLKLGAMSDRGINKLLARKRSPVGRALRLADGIAVAEWADVKPGETEPRRLIFSEKFACPVSGFSITEIEPKLFSFNSPAGACPACDGLGMKLGFDSDLVVPDKDRTLHKGAIAPWAKGPSPLYTQTLQALARHYGFSMDEPWWKLPEEARRVVLEGSGKDKIRFVYDDDHHRHRLEQVVEKMMIDSLGPLIYSRLVGRPR